MFKVPHILEWLVVGTGPNLLEEIRKAPKDIMSSTAVADEVSLFIILWLIHMKLIRKFLQTQYTLGANMRTNPYHMHVIQSTFTRTLPILIPEVHDEVVHVFNDFIPATEGKVENRPLLFMQQRRYL